MDNAVPYKRVQVLMLSWEEGNPDVTKQLVQLKVALEKYYNFTTEHWPIPTLSSHLNLNTKINNFVRTHDGPQTLLAIYYGGHADVYRDYNYARWKL